MLHPPTSLTFPGGSQTGGDVCVGARYVIHGAAGADFTLCAGIFDGIELLGDDEVRSVTFFLPSKEPWSLRLHRWEETDADVLRRKNNLDHQLARLPLSTHPVVAPLLDHGWAGSDWESVYVFAVYPRRNPLSTHAFAQQFSAHQPPDLDGLLAGLGPLVQALDELDRGPCTHGPLSPVDGLWWTSAGEPQLLGVGLLSAVAYSNWYDVPQMDENFDGTLLIPIPSYIGEGVIEYASPETNRDPTFARADVFTLGVLTYRLLTDTHPYGGKPALWVRRDDSVPPRIEGISRAANSAISRALHPDVNQRFQSRAAFLDALRAPDSWLDRLLG